MGLKNTYFILRHGETIYQVEKKEFTYPELDSPAIRLTKDGERMIQRAAKQLKKEGIDFIYSSDLFRTRQTAGIVARQLKLKINLDKRLRDINLGVYRNGTKKEFYKDFPDPRGRFSKKPKNGESWDDVKERMLDFLREIDEKHKTRQNFASQNLSGRGKKILIVSHGDPLWILEGAIRGLTNQELLDEIFVNPVRGPRPRRGSRLWRPASNGVTKSYIKVGEIRRLATRV